MEEELMAIIKKNKNIKKYLEGKKEIKKIIFIKNKILNIIVN